MWNQYDSKKEEIFPSDVRDELKSRKLWHVMDHKASTAEEICITVYENQKFRPFFKGWGSELGVHLSVYVDRAPFTDETGKIRIRYGFLIAIAVYDRCTNVAKEQFVPNLQLSIGYTQLHFD